MTLLLLISYGGEKTLEDFTFLKKFVDMVIASGLEWSKSEANRRPDFFALAELLLMQSRMLKLAQSMLTPSLRN